MQISSLRSIDKESGELNQLGDSISALWLIIFTLKLMYKPNNGLHVVHGMIDVQKEEK